MAATSGKEAMKNRASQRADQEPNDVGTLWTMKRDELTARCALLAWPDNWELRVIVDGRTMLAERCQCSEEAFSLAERWRLRLTDQSWQQIIPRPERFPHLDGRP